MQKSYDYINTKILLNLCVLAKRNIAEFVTNKLQLTVLAEGSVCFSVVLHLS